MIAQFLLAVLGTLSFAILFDAPPRHYPTCSVIGGVGWVVYLLILNSSDLRSLACFGAGLIITVLARLTSTFLKTPAIVFLTAGIFPLVPGGAIYYTAYYLFSGDSVMAGTKGLEALVIAGTLALGILFGSAVPQRIFLRTANLFHKQ